MTTTVVVKFREVQRLGNKCRGSGTTTRQTGTGTPKLEFNSGQVVPVPL